MCPTRFNYSSVSLGVFVLSLFYLPAPATAQAPDQAFNNALRQKNTEQVIEAGQRLYQRAAQAGAWDKAGYYAGHVANAYCQTGTSRFKAGRYTDGISPTMTGLRWLGKSRTGVDTLHFQLLSLVAACYGRIPLADSATYWYTRTSAYLSGHPPLRQTIPADVCGYYLSHAYFLSRTGDFRRAFDYLQIAAELAKTTGNRRLSAIATNYQGNYFFQLRQFDRADIYYRRALRGYRTGSVDQCWGYVILGNNDRVAGRPAAGLVHLQDGQQRYQTRIARQPQDRDVDLEIQSTYYMAECQRALNQAGIAATNYRRCLALHQQQYGNKGELMAASWLGLGHLAQRRSDFSQAMALAQQGITASCYRLDGGASPADYVGTVVNEQKLYESLQLQADLWRETWLTRRSQSALLKAVYQYDQALTIAARLRRNLMPVESKFFLSNKVGPCLERAMACCYELFRQTGQEQHKNRLFALMERHRMMTTSDLLHEKYRLAKAIPVALSRREQSLRQQKMTLEKAIADKPTGPRSDSLQRQFNRVNVASYGFLDSLEQAYPRYFSLKYDSRSLSITQVQQHLPQGVGYLTYYVSNQYLIGCFVSRSGSSVFRVPLPPHFAYTVDQLWQSIRHPPGMFAYTGQKQAAAVYDWLIRPIADSLRSVQRLIISRDGLLHYVPFDLLQPAVGAPTYVGDQVAISYGYSAELTFFDARKPQPGRPRVAGFAPYSRTNQPGSADSAYALKWSLAEIQAWKGNVFSRERATKAAFLRVAPVSDVVVLATHALANEAQPEQSYVAFHPVGADSLLRATEIASLSLDSLKLIVLNACEGNAGVLQSGEGPLSLARVFRLAGCRTILTTSWKASDESTAAFNRLFQQYVADGLPTDLALQKTRSDFRTDSRFAEWRHPFHWANFALIGAPTILYPRPAVPSGILWAVGLIILTLLGWFAWHQWRLFIPRQTP